VNEPPHQIGSPRRTQLTPAHHSPPHFHFRQKTRIENVKREGTLYGRYYSIVPYGSGLLCNLVSDDTTQQRRLIIFQPLVYTISYLGEFFFSLCCVRAVILLPDDDDSIPVDSTGNLQEQLSAFSFVVFLFFLGKMGRKEMCTCSLLSTSFTIFEKWSGKGQLLGCVFILHIRCWWPRTVFSSFFSRLMDPFGGCWVILFFGVLPQKPQLRGITRAAMKLSITGVEIVMRAVFFKWINKMVETLFDQVFQFPRCHLNSSPAPPCIICGPRDLYTIGFRNYEICCHSTIKERGGGSLDFKICNFKNDPPPSLVCGDMCRDSQSARLIFNQFFYLIQSSDFGVFQVVVWFPTRAFMKPSSLFIYLGCLCDPARIFSVCEGKSATWRSNI
jgi:hypothetical protein